MNGITYMQIDLRALWAELICVDEDRIQALHYLQLGHQAIQEPREEIRIVRGELDEVRRRLEAWER